MTTPPDPTTAPPPAAIGDADRPSSSARPGDPDGRALAEEVLAAIGSLRRRVRRAAQAGWPLAGLTGAQAELLRLLRRQPGLSVAAAAAELDLAPNSVSTLVGRLAAAGLVRREPAEHDRRVARLHLTPRAAETLERWRDRRLHAMAAAVTALPEADRAHLRAALPLLGRLAELTTPADSPPPADPDAIPELDPDTRHGATEPRATYARATEPPLADTPPDATPADGGQEGHAP